MAQLNTSTSSSTSFAHKGNFGNTSNALHVNSLQPWIIDSGAFDHMAGLSNVFSTYNPCSEKDKVRTADGTQSSISSKGVVNISSSLALFSILHVPISQLTCFPLVALPETLTVV